MLRSKRDAERLRREAAADKRRADREEWHRQVAREASGGATGFRYAIECGLLWVDANGKHGLDPFVFHGDRASSQARASLHRDKNNFGGGIHHAPIVCPEGPLLEHRDAFLKNGAGYKA